jgi:hypothetical protein
MMGESHTDTFHHELRLSLQPMVPRLSRSPHPYHRKSQKLIDSENLPPKQENSSDQSRTPKSSSDSGTDADDESTGFLKRLPAPPARPRKGLRTAAGSVRSGDTAPWLKRRPAWSPFVRTSSRATSGRSSSEDSLSSPEKSREIRHRQRRIGVLRRLCESALLLSVGAIVLLRKESRQLILVWNLGGELCVLCLRLRQVRTRS